jgi:hypothetical protein
MAGNDIKEKRWGKLENLERYGILRGDWLKSEKDG